MKKNRIRHFAKNLAALGVGCVVALGLLEVALRIFNPIESRVRGDEIVLPANKVYIFESSNITGTDQRIGHTKNSMGFRGPEPPATGLDDYLSLVTVGGSTTECFYLSDGKDWPSVLQEFLKHDFSPVWLNNAGLDGHSTFGHTVLLRDILADMKPRIVVFLVGVNDRGKLKAGDHTASHIKGSIKFNSIEGFVKSAAAYSEVASGTLNFYRYLRARSKGLTHRNVDVSSLPRMALETDSAFLEPHKRAFVPAYEQRLQSLIRLTKDSQIEPVLVTQPLLYGDGIDPSTGVDLGTVRVSDKGSGHRAWVTLELYNEATRKVGEQEGILTIDLARELDKDSEYFYDGLHFSKAGAARVAQIIYEHLRPHLEEEYREFTDANR